MHTLVVALLVVGAAAQCTAPVAATSNLAADVPPTFLNWHNYYRCLVYTAYPTATTGVIRNFVWDAALATSAQKYSNACYWGHNAAPATLNININQQPNTGENIYMYASTLANTAPGYPPLANLAYQAVLSWYNERAAWVTTNPAFSSATSTCVKDTATNTFKVCGHFTQIVWTTGTKQRTLGCGTTFCPRMTGTTLAIGTTYPVGYYAVCRYTPFGNVVYSPTARPVLAVSTTPELGEGTALHTGGTISVHHQSNITLVFVAVAVAAVAMVAVAVAVVVRRRRAAVIPALDQTELLA